MKKLLLLGGLRYLIPVIKAAQNMGHYVITCDYLPENIAHKYSDEYHNVSILDKDAVLKLAQKLKIDGIMSFAVDPGVTTAAYVSENMNIPSPGPYNSVNILQNKGLFRAFLEKHNFNVPKSRTFNNNYEAISTISDFELPVIVKPVDSAGSKGVMKVSNEDELPKAIENALSNSPSKTFIIEDYLQGKTFSSDSDSFSVNGDLKFVSFSNQRFDANSPNPYTPSAYSWPSSISEENQNYLKSELQRLITLLKMESSIYNIEVREATNGKAYIMEVSPRGGGNRLSEMVKSVTGIDLISMSIQAALGEEISKVFQPKYNGSWAEIILYSNVNGFFKELYIEPVLNEYLKEIDIWVNEGDKVNAFIGANETIGTLVLQCENASSLESILADYTKYIKVIVN
ncbi:ATP-grasp domain-containing protein [Gelidibacter gilvus]|uniref:ATP-grasp domain-containing protein n=1 Tax=Gelidibacter gilvus TaxID=59602 RepID=A0A4Q0XF30_9FLAO|nr:ATP-grasp domain-containing protein [Gelidibacter gilvus]RXJ46030.1 ATP-grasp domain-containing protein [Gelidibacter gilvus]